jgi:hypothetical protein
LPPGSALCPASPSLQWVPWVSVPHLLGFSSSQPSVLCSAKTTVSPSRVASLHARFPIPCGCSLEFVSPSGITVRCALDLDSAWPYFFTGVAFTGYLHKEMTVLSSSQAAPLCTCPARRSRWCPFSSPLRLQDHSLPGPPTRRLSRAFARLSSWTTTIQISGLSHAACTLATPGFIRTLTDTHAGSLEIWWLTSSHGNWAETRTHWVTVSNFTTSFPIPRI